MVAELKYRLYPHGTLGRVFIDLALHVIDRLGGAIEFNDTLVIKSVQKFIDALDSVYKEIIAGAKINPFPTRGLSKKIQSIVKGGPASIVDFVIKALMKGGYNLLEERGTSPLIMRVEFYEYSKRGYVSYGGFKDHPYREATVLDIALAVVGSYIAVSSRLENRIYYLLPHPHYIDISTIKKLKDVLRDAIANYLSKGRELDIVATYKLTREISRLGMIVNPVIGDLLVVEESGKRYTVSGVYKLVSSNWEILLEKLDEKTISMLDTLVGVTDDIARRGERIPVTYNVLAHLYRYAIGSDESLYYAVRELLLIAENMKRVEEGHRVGEEWSLLFSSFRKQGVKTPSRLATALANRLSELARLSSREVL